MCAVAAPCDLFCDWPCDWTWLADAPGPGLSGVAACAPRGGVANGAEVVLGLDGPGDAKEPGPLIGLVDMVAPR
ncbi:protein of unknown function [Paraburkholderia dioscoreae]|uniref:Uncharacterized protein n=1 Tax=Paraburkholderia dioscoreae TaxID=2604047 RepID=A0A5Q4ZK38_9BURK|nr:protein of unknown function [Paraburkholderia dioscoreae]VVD27888.1 protein of unknown function [Paraburkholderia dioscoreae]